MRAFEVQVWTASVSEAQPHGWAALEAVLDRTELANGRRLRFDADRQAYVLAHALRRFALGQELQIEPSALVFSHDEQGRPLLASRASRPVFFSHSHTRGQVAFAMSFDGPVGIDVEAAHGSAADPALLDAFVVRPDAEVCTNGQFYFYWTALEAFWKAAGAGLSSSNPKIICRRNESGLHEITLAGAAQTQASACVIPVSVGPGISAALAVGYGAATAPAMRIGRPPHIRTSEKTHFFGCKRRLLRSSLTTIVSA